MKKVIVVLIVAGLCLSLVGCFTNTHLVGKGAQGNTQVEKKSWYILWGLVPLTKVDSQTLAGGAADYTVKDQFTALDFVINIFTGYVTVYARTTTVTK